VVPKIPKLEHDPQDSHQVLSLKKVLKLKSGFKSIKKVLEFGAKILKLFGPEPQVWKIGQKLSEIVVQKFFHMHFYVKSQNFAARFARGIICNVFRDKIANFPLDTLQFSPC